MKPVYKIEIPKATYEQILIPIASEAELKLSTEHKDDKVVVYIEDDSIVRTLKCVLIRKIDDYEVVQSALSKMQIARLDSKGAQSQLSGEHINNSSPYQASGQE